MSLHIQIEHFEGPMALLLHLIRKEEMNIFNINVHQITRQYLDYIKSIKKLDLELAGEFITMAATLIHIKSKMLLPQYDEEGEEVEEDPREGLAQQLLEYERYKEGADKLYEMSLLGRDVFVRGQKINLPKVEEGIVIEEENALFALISSYRWAVKKVKQTTYKVFEDLQSISERILEINKLINRGKVLLRELLSPKISAEKRGNQMLVTFLSLLELSKMGFISLFQAENFSDIHIESRKQIDGDVISQLKEYNYDLDVYEETIKDDDLIQSSENFDKKINESGDSSLLVNTATEEDILEAEKQLNKKEMVGEL